MRSRCILFFEFHLSIIPQRVQSANSVTKCGSAISATLVHTSSKFIVFELITQPLIHSLYTFIHQTYTMYMSYTRYWVIFNHWYIAYTLLYIRHTPCTCRRHGIGPYTNGDTFPVHIYTSDTHPVHVVYAILGHISIMVIHSFYTFYTSEIHPVHVVYTVLGHIQPLIHSLYTFIHQTYTL